ncbi:MAG: mechanosensitive ion channel domain-containing protein [Candidatus Thermoplasmatota archaeon]|nr:mechanosensitive ion channel domain-containing protein [Candidatus Thermoplasmatota archaeon]
MDSLIEVMPNWQEEMFGFNQGTLTVLLFCSWGSIVIRIALAKVISRAKMSLGIDAEVAKNAIQQSSGTLATAVATAIMMKIIGSLEQANNGLMPEYVTSMVLPIIELVFYIALVTWAFKLVPAVYSIVDRFDGDGEMEGSTKTLVSSLESLMRFLIIAFGSVMIASSLGFDLSAILAGLGISGIALALAAKDSISNIFGAITVLLDRPFEVGDYVVIGGSEGEVIEINLRTTLIRTSIDSVITFPNASLVNTAVENYGLRRWRRYQPLLHLDLKSDPEAIESFCDGILESINSNPKTTKKDASSVRVSTIGTQSIDISCNLYWDTSSGTEEKELRQQFLLDVMRTAQALDLHFFEPRVRRTVSE